MLAGDIKGIYETLVQPPLSPPNWLFGIVWPILYILMGVAFYRLITVQDMRKKTLPTVLFCLQLLLNFFWSIVFFGNDMLWYAFVIIIALDIAVFACIATFMRHDKIAAWLLIPYMVWICFATYLNLACAILN